MSTEALAKVVQRAISDAKFRRQLSSDTAGALRGFDLSTDELSALRAGDAGRLSTLGVDERMSRAFAIGGMAAATRMAQSDLTAGAPTAFDDGAAGVGRTIIPHDPESSLTDDPDGFLAANARASGGPGAWAGSTHELNEGSGGVTPQSVRAGDDWKYADKSVAQGSAAPTEGSPEADAAAQAASGGGRIGTARIDDASGASGGARSVNDDPDGFLAANKNADFSGATAGDGTAFLDDSEAYRALQAVHGPGGARDPFANAEASGGSSAETTAFIDESEAYLTKVGYDSAAATTANTRATWSGDENAGPASVADDSGGASPNASEGGPNINP
jgi:hypothetical protein